MSISKKLLLTSVLSSAIMVAPNVGAVDYNITYNATSKVLEVKTNGEIVDFPIANIGALRTYMYTTIAEKDGTPQDEYKVKEEHTLTVASYTLNDAIDADFIEIHEAQEILGLARGINDTEALELLNKASTPRTSPSPTSSDSGDTEDDSDLQSSSDSDSDEISTEKMKKLISAFATLADDIKNKTSINIPEDFATVLQNSNEDAVDTILDNIKVQFDQMRANDPTKYAKEIPVVRNSKFMQSALSGVLNQLKEDTTDMDTEEKAEHAKELQGLKDHLSLFLDTNPTDATTVPEVQKPDSDASGGIMHSALATRAVIDSRIASVTGVNSGDMFTSYGAWVKAVYSSGTQKAYGNELGYKFNQKGATIGVDTGNDDYMVGIAYSFFKNDIKNKSTKQNKNDVKSHSVTLYGRVDATNELFVNGQLQFGKSKIKKARIDGTAFDEIIKAKTKATTIATKIEVGYDYAVDSSIHLIPTIGFAYTDVKVKGYKESQEDALVRNVGKRTTNRISAITGVTAQYVSDMGSVKLIPEIHANVDYAFRTKNSNTSITILDDIDPISTPSQKLTKAIYKIGTSLKVTQCEKYEVSAGYDFGFAKKFHSHTGSLKLRINF